MTRSVPLILHVLRNKTILTFSKPVCHLRAEWVNQSRVCYFAQCCTWQAADRSSWPCRLCWPSAARWGPAAHTWWTAPLHRLLPRCCCPLLAVCGNGHSPMSRCCRSTCWCGCPGCWLDGKNTKSLEEFSVCTWELKTITVLIRDNLNQNIFFLLQLLEFIWFISSGIISLYSYHDQLN